MDVELLGYIKWCFLPLWDLICIPKSDLGGASHEKLLGMLSFLWGLWVPVVSPMTSAM